MVEVDGRMDEELETEEEQKQKQQQQQQQQQLAPVQWELAVGASRENEIQGGENG